MQRGHLPHARRAVQRRRGQQRMDERTEPRAGGPVGIRRQPDHLHSGRLALAGRQGHCFRAPGDRLHHQARRRGLLPRPIAPAAPVAVALEIALDRLFRHRLRQQFFLADPEADIDIEIEDMGIPPDHGVRRVAARCTRKAVQTRRDRQRGSRVAVRPLQHRVAAEARAGRRRLGRTPLGLGRVDGGVQRAGPAAFARAVAHRRHHQQVAGAGGRDVRHADRLGLLPLQLFCLVLDEVPWRAAGQPQCAQPPFRIDVAVRSRAPQPAGRVRQHDHRKFEPLGAVHRHQPHPFSPLFQDRRLLPASGVRFLQQVLDKAPEREAAGRVVLASHLGHLQDVGQRLPPGLAHGEAGVGAGRLQQLAQGDVHRPLVAPAVQRLQQLERAGDRLEPVVLRGRPSTGPQLGRNPERARQSVPVEIREQRLVVDGKERSVQRREDRQPVVRPFDRRQRRPDRRHLFTLVERPPAHEQMRDVARLERVGVRPRHVGPVVLEAPEQHADVMGLHWHPALPAGARRAALRDCPAALIDEPAHEGPYGIRQRAFDRGGGDPAPAVRPRHRERNDRRLSRRVAARRRQRYVCRPAARPAGHLRGERAVDAVLDRRHAAKAARQVEQRHAARRELRPHAGVYIEVGAAETVDRLLGIADDEERALARAGSLPIPLVGIVRRQQQQQLRLQRVRILEFVDEDPRVASLEVAPRAGVVPDEITGPQQQIEKVQGAAGRLELLVARDRLSQLPLQAGHQVGVRRGPKTEQTRRELRVPLVHLLPLHAAAVAPAAPPPRFHEVAIRGQLHELRFETICIPPAGRRRADRVGEQPHGAGVEIQPVPPPVRRLAAQRGKSENVVGKRVDHLLA